MKVESEKYAYQAVLRGREAQLKFKLKILATFLRWMEVKRRM